MAGLFTGIAVSALQVVLLNELIKSALAGKIGKTAAFFGIKAALYLAVILPFALLVKEQVTMLAAGLCAGLLACAAVCAAVSIIKNKKKSREKGDDAVGHGNDN